MMASPLILASGSTVRRKLMENAGLVFEVVPASVDERVIEERLPADQRDPVSVALHLAIAKAREVSARMPEAVVVGCDQTMSLGDRIFHKAQTLEDARRTLEILRGQEHSLNSAICLVRNGDVLWSHVDRAGMQMRQFSDLFLAGYIERNGEALMSSVGCYQLEGEGIQLFDAIDGNYFTILGLPLLPLLTALRQYGVNHA